MRCSPAKESAVAPENLLQDVELALDLADVEAGREAVRRQLVRRGDDRLHDALAHAPDDDLEQVLQMGRDSPRCPVVLPRGMALVQLGDRLVHDPTRRIGENL